MLLGDFNAHSPLPGCNRLDSRGNLIERFVLDSSLCLLNEKDPTFYSSTHHTFTSIDLSIVSPVLAPDITWKVLQNPYGSDHFPIILEQAERLPVIPMRAPRWKLDKADWATFLAKAAIDTSLLLSLSPEKSNTYVTEAIINAAMNSIPQTSGKLPRRCRPWWNKDCDASKKRRNIFRRYPIVANYIEFKKTNAQFRWTTKQAKRKSWKAYVSSLYSFVSTKEAWDRFHRIQGDYRSFTIPFISPVSSSSALLLDQANLLGKHFADLSSSSNYTPTFRRYKTIAETQRICMFSDDSAPYNQPFTSSELEVAIAVPKSSAPGPDGIHYELLQHLSSDSGQALLTFYNFLWYHSVFPEDWKTAHVIPLLKPGKDRSLPNSYRPIALTSCLCKTYERLVNKRLMYVLESNNILHVNQCGFRAGRSSLDHVVRLETVVREAFLRRQHCVSVFFDLQKAYDTAWRWGIQRDLYSYGIRGRMLQCVQSFLSARSFRVRLGTTLSTPFFQENGVSQGGVLSRAGQLID